MDAVLLRSLPLALVLVLAGSAPAHAGRDRALRSVEADLSEVAGLRVEPTERCRQQVLDELVEGRRHDDGCQDDRALAGRALVRWRDDFGFVEHRVVELSALRLVLGVARRCRQWPLRSPSRDVLRRTDVAAAGCRLRRYQGPLSLTFIDHRGRRSTPLPPLSTDEDGRIELRFASLDQALRALGHGELADYQRVELGDGGWAGTIDLARLLRFRAQWHLSWVRRGRGVAGLFAIGHPEHPEVDAARSMAADALLSRQEHDVQRVREGELTARDYLDRHPLSPYRLEVERWIRAQWSEREAEAQRDGTTEAEPEGAPTGADPTADADPSGRVAEADADAPEPSEPGTEPDEPEPGGRRSGGTNGGIGP